VISFSDAIFAFSITIVLLSIEVPPFASNVSESDFLKEVWNLGSSFETYAISFGIIGIYWVAYHRLFNSISASHPIIVGLNLVFLFFVTLISLFTVLNISYGSLQIAFIFFQIILVLTGCMLPIIWITAVKTKSVLGGTSSSLNKFILLQSSTPPFIFLVSIGISFISLDVAQYFWLIIIPSRIIVNKKLPPNRT
jgi:uncharacterized membrane protein